MPTIRKGETNEAYLARRRYVYEQRTASYCSQFDPNLLREFAHQRYAWPDPGQTALFPLLRNETYEHAQIRICNAANRLKLSRTYRPRTKQMTRGIHFWWEPRR